MIKSFTIYASKSRMNEKNVYYPTICNINSKEDLAKAIQFDNVPALFVGKRSKVTFKSANCIIADMDNTDSDNPDDWYSPMDIVTALEDVEFYYSFSKSHMKEKGGKAPRPKFHMYFPLSKAVTSGKEYESMVASLSKLLNDHIDQQATDCARFLYGVENPICEYVEGNLCIDEYIEQNEIGFQDFSTSSAPAQEAEAPADMWNVQEWFKSHNIKYSFDGTTDEGAKKFIVSCPWSCNHTSEHSEKESVVYQASDGYCLYKCLHEHCKNKEFVDYYSFYEPRSSVLAEQWKDNKANIDNQGETKAVYNNESKQFQPTKPFQFLNMHDVFSEGLEQLESKLAPEVISGVLRQGDKMMLSSVSKAGKTFLLINLAIQLANGGEWLGNKCKKSKVVYINCEIRQTSFNVRMAKQCTKLGYDLNDDNTRNLVVLPLRSETIPMDKLNKMLIPALRGSGVEVLILDPIYKVMTGDENSASDMGKLCTEFDKICEELGCSFIYCHHYSKGGMSYKNSMDRASGSGVFSRDADAIISVSPIDTNEKELEDLAPSPSATAWCVDYTLREFAPHDITCVWFSDMVHTVDDNLIPLAKKLGDNLSKSPKRKGKSEKQKEQDKDYWQLKIQTMYNVCVQDGKPTKLSDIAKELDINPKTLRSRVRDYCLGKFKVSNGLIMPDNDDET